MHCSHHKFTCTLLSAGAELNEEAGAIDREEHPPSSACDIEGA